VRFRPQFGNGEVQDPFHVYLCRPVEIILCNNNQAIVKEYNYVLGLRWAYLLSRLHVKHECLGVSYPFEDKA
jgi:hypothetical protein